MFSTAETIVMGAAGIGWSVAMFVAGWYVERRYSKKLEAQLATLQQSASSAAAVIQKGATAVAGAAGTVSEDL